MPLNAQILSVISFPTPFCMSWIRWVIIKHRPCACQQHDPKRKRKKILRTIDFLIPFETKDKSNQPVTLARQCSPSTCLHPSSYQQLKTRVERCVLCSHSRRSRVSCSKFGRVPPAGVNDAALGAAAFSFLAFAAIKHGYNVGRVKSSWNIVFLEMLSKAFQQLTQSETDNIIKP